MPATRAVTIDTPAPGLLFRRLVGRERIGRLFELEVELIAESATLAFDDLVGERMTIHVELADGNVRHLNGIVSRFAQTGQTERYSFYRATLRPWLWLLTHKARCQIYQEMSVPDIIKSIFREHGLSDFRESLSGTYSAFDYRVQYRETDFAFVSRLMEEQGIYYFFEHEDGRHTLVLADSTSAHSPISGYEEIPFYASQEGVQRERDHIETWSIAEEMRPGAYLLEDFDFTRPKADLEVKLVSQDTLADAALEIYDYPGGYTVRGDGETYVRTRLEEVYAEQEIIKGEGDVRGLSPGATFDLVYHPRDDQNRQHLIVACAYEAAIEGYVSGTDREGNGDIVFRCHFEAIDAQRPYRPARTTQRPFVHGPQTAIVVGKSGEEIWTDEYGRVKVQFHWDRLGASDEKSSCWVRVAQVWAGAKWGAIHIPRIGQEVVVDFLEGDPDRPLITGRLYNADNMPPYALPTNATQSGIKSRSSKGGSAENFNEIRFEDKKGEEQLYTQAEKDLEILVKNDETRTVNHDRKKTVKNDETVLIEGNRTETVKKDETITVEGNRTETVKKDETITVEGNRTETVKKDETTTVEGSRTDTVKVDETRTIEGNRTETVKADETITVEGNRTETVKADETITVDGSRTETVKTDETITVQGKRTETVKGDETVSVDGKRAVTVKSSDKLDVKQKLELIAGQELVIKVGAASITLKASGDIEIKGANVKIQASAQAEVKGGAAVSVAAPSIKMG
jgi:type VI secretion system secreted protein VgrG